MDKSGLRKLYLQKRKELSPKQVEELSSGIVRNFSTLSFEGINVLHVFYPIVGKHEFDTLLLIGWLKATHPHIKLVLSKSNPADSTLENYLWTEDTVLKMNQWGITEPEGGQQVAPREIDMVLIPLLAYDVKGNRIGYGKGFYDRFLKDCRMDTVKAGISFFEPEEEVFETNEYDIPLNLCITPLQIHQF